MNRYTERPKVASRKEDLICLLMCFVYLSLHTFLKITPQNFDRTNCSGWNLPWILSALDWFFGDRTGSIWLVVRMVLQKIGYFACSENTTWPLCWLNYSISILWIRDCKFGKSFPAIYASLLKSDRATGARLQKGWKLAGVPRSCRRPAGSGLSRTFPELFFLRCCRAPARGIIGEAQPWICFLLALNQWGGGGEVRLSRTQKGEAAEGRAEQLLTELRIFFSCLLQVSELTDL